MRDVREGWFSRLADDDWEANADKWPKPAIAVRCDVVTGCPSGYVRELLDAADGASVEDVKAGILLIALARTAKHVAIHRHDGTWSAGTYVTNRDSFSHGPDHTSPAAAVLALAAMVEEGRDA